MAQAAAKQAPNSLTGNQKKELVAIYLESIFGKNSDDFESINQRLKCIPGVSFEVTQDIVTIIQEPVAPGQPNPEGCQVKTTMRDDLMREQLMPFIHQHIKGEEFYEILKKLYKNKYDLNNDRSIDATFSKTTALEKAMHEYHNCEVKQTNRKALKDTLFLCIFIVTIPFTPLIYLRRRHHHAKGHFFVVKHLDMKNFPGLDPYKSFGLINKLTQNHKDPKSAQKKVEKVVCSKKNDNIRKFSVRSSYNPYNKEELTSLTLFGTKAQFDKYKYGGIRKRTAKNPTTSTPKSP